MPWSQNDYPPSFKNLPDPTRNKAIEIANALLKDGKSDGDAIPIAISRAKMWAKNQENGLGKTAEDQQQNKPSKLKEFGEAAISAKILGGAGYLGGHTLGHKFVKPVEVDSEGTNSRLLLNARKKELMNKQLFRSGAIGGAVGGALGIGGTLLGYSWHNNQLEHNNQPVVDELKDDFHMDHQDKQADIQDLIEFMEKWSEQHC